MANTVTLLSYANTFADWVITTNALARENNDFAANNFTKPSGTLYLNDTSLGLQVANNAIFGGQLQVQGTGSSGYVQNNLRVDGQLVLQNTTTSIQASGVVFANGSGNGLVVANNASVTGNVHVTNNGVVARIFTANAINANTVVTSPVLNSTGNVFGEIITANTAINAPLVSVSTTLNVGGTTRTATLQANTNLIAPTASISGTVYANGIQGNTFVNTATVITNTLQSNTSINTATVTATTSNASVLNVTSRINANNATAYIEQLSVGTGGLTITGAFTISGAVVYNTDTFTLNSNQVTGQNAFISNYRGPSNSNAIIRWSESNKYWDIRDVDNPTSYSRILTQNLISDSVTSTSSTIPASVKAANTVLSFAQSVYDNQNTQVSIIQGVDNTQNTNISSANNYAHGAYRQANAATNSATFSYERANAAFNKANTGGGTFIGTTGSATANTGVISFSSNNGVTVYGSSNVLNISTSQDLRTTASPTFNGLTLTNALPLSQGGTGATSAAAALTTLLPTGTTSGYVLTTGGPGTFYWAAGGGGGSGATPGTTINSTRLTYTAVGNANTYTTPTYTPGASQLRVYFDGVRQFASGYTETSNTSVRFGPNVPAGVNILLEVDGYIDNPYYANNIAYSINADISSTANTIQLAIDGLTSKLITNYANTAATINFTNLITATTPSTNTSNTQIATTAFVKNALNNSNTYSISVSGTAALSTALITTNNYQVNTLGVGTTADTSNTGSIRATGAITAGFSDDKLKNKLGNIEDALSKVAKLNGFYYEPNDLAQSLGYTNKKEVGVSAQEVQLVLPEIIASAPIDDKYLTVHYERLIPLLIEAIKELKKEIDSLKGDNK